ncbi:hypothetical protein ES703_82486 [subsurface metagenome]
MVHNVESHATMSAVLVGHLGVRADDVVPDNDVTDLLSMSVDAN